MINKTRSNNIDETIWTMRRRPTGAFEYARLELEPGYQKLKFLATWDDDSDEVNATIDDIKVEKCSPS